MRELWKVLEKDFLSEEKLDYLLDKERLTYIYKKS
jgi:hypothetical protein